jgi:hypothetical protein
MQKKKKCQFNAIAMLCTYRYMIKVRDNKSVTVYHRHKRLDHILSLCLIKHHAMDTYGGVEV